jgi:hypothetical protein
MDCEFRVDRFCEEIGDNVKVENKIETDQIGLVG